jgi:uncharacterized protein YbjQ (UPF0145 family)
MKCTLRFKFGGKRLLNRVFKILVVLGGSLLMAACSSSWSTSNTVRGGAVGSAATAPAARDIVVTEEDITDRAYRVLGDVNVTVNKTTIFNADPTREMVNEKLREEAHALNADAVILVRYGSVGIGLMSWGSLDGKGRAIAFTE